MSTTTTAMTDQPAEATGAAASGGSVTPAAAPGRGRLVAWLLSVTRPVLAPLLGSTACRIADLLAGVALFALGAHAVVVTAVAAAEDAPIPSPWGVLAIMAGLSALKAALRYAEQFLGHVVAFKALELLRAEIFRALIPRAPRVMATSRSGDLLARATKDVDRIEVFFAHTFAPAVSAVVVPAAVLAVVGLQTSWEVAGAGAGALLAAIVLMPAAGWRRSLLAARRTAAARSVLTQHVTDSVQGMSEVVGYGRSDERLEQMRRLDDAVAAASRPAAIWAGIRRGGVQMLILAAPIAMIAVGAPRAASGTMDVAVVAASAAAALRLAETVRGVEELAVALNASFASAERVYEVVHAPIELPDGQRRIPPAPAHEIVWEGVSYSYPGSPSRALDGVSARARAGQWTCLVGVSGSGKTTLARLALRCDDPQGGRVLIDGADLRELRADCLRREAALVAQHAHLFRATVADNVRLARPEASRAEVEEACRAAGVHEEVLAMAQGYDTMLGERGATVSGGQRQRLALARALLARPGVLVLDEFTSHLDPELAERVRASVRQWMRGGTVIEVTHRLGGVSRADHVVVLDGGRAVQEGDPTALLAVEGPLRRLAARQGC